MTCQDRRGLVHPVVFVVRQQRPNTTVGARRLRRTACLGTDGLWCWNTAQAASVKDYTDLVQRRCGGKVSYRMRRPTADRLLPSRLGMDPFAAYC